MNVKVTVGNVSIEIDGINPVYSRGMEHMWSHQLQQLVVSTITEAVERAASADAARVQAREPVGGNPSDEGGRLEPDGDGEERTGTPKT